MTLIFNAMYLLKKLQILNILLYSFNFHNVYVKAEDKLNKKLE